FATPNFSRSRLRKSTPADSEPPPPRPISPTEKVVVQPPQLQHWTDSHEQGSRDEAEGSSQAMWRGQFRSSSRYGEASSNQNAMTPQQPGRDSDKFVTMREQANVHKKIENVELQDGEEELLNENVAEGTPAEQFYTFVTQPRLSLTH